MEICEPTECIVIATDWVSQLNLRQEKIPIKCVTYLNKLKIKTIPLIVIS